MRKALIGLLLAATMATPVAVQAQDRGQNARSERVQKHERQEARSQQRHSRAQARSADRPGPRAERFERRGDRGMERRVERRGDGGAERRAERRGDGGAERRAERRVERPAPVVDGRRERARSVTEQRQRVERAIAQRQVREEQRREAWRDRTRTPPSTRQSDRREWQGRRDNDRDGRWQGRREGNRDWRRDGNRDWRHDGRWEGRRDWSRNWSRDWRNDRRYDWRSYRYSHRHIYRPGRYYSPFRHHSYSRFSIGFFLDPLFYSNRYWIGDPWYYRLPPAYPGTRWIRYYDDVLLVDLYTGEVIDVIYDFFW